MKLTLITPPETVKEEMETIRAIFGEGLDRLHLRKPGWRRSEWDKYLEKFPVELLSKTSIHGQPELALEYGMGGLHLSSGQEASEIPGAWKGTRSKSAHSFREIEDRKDQFDYFLLSPIFDSISKEGHEGKFEMEKLKEFLQHSRTYQVFALGGIKPDNIGQVKSAGFDGVALLGHIWQFADTEGRMEAFKKVKHAETNL